MNDILPSLLAMGFVLLMIWVIGPVPRRRWPGSELDRKMTERENKEKARCVKSAPP